MNTLFDRMLRAAKLDVALYEEVEADTGATAQAALAVVVSSVAYGIGAIGQGGASGLFGGVIGALLGWYVWAFLTYLIGTKLLSTPETDADVGQLLRTLGFASAPGVIRVFGFIPVVGALAIFVGQLWMLVAMVIAVRQALDYTSTVRAVGVVLIGWVIQGLVMWLVMMMFGVRFSS